MQLEPCSEIPHFLLSLRPYGEVEKVGDNQYDKKTYRRNHRKYINIAAHSNNRSKQMRHALVHKDNPVLKDNPMAILAGGV